MSRLVQRSIAARIIMAVRLYVNSEAWWGVDVIRCGNRIPRCVPSLLWGRVRGKRLDKG
jgi:hypothetical protein